MQIGDMWATHHGAAPDIATCSAGPSSVDVEHDRNGLEVLDRAACFGLLGTVPVGRVGLSMAALPVVLPVNFVLCRPPWQTDAVVMIRSGEGSKVDAALAQHVVAFEIDGFDAVARSGWSVIVQGLTRVLVDDEEIAWAEALPLESWANASADSFIELSTDVVRGRRFRSRAAPVGSFA